MQTQSIFIILSVFTVWLIVISLALYRITALFSKLTKGVGVHDLKKVLELVISKEQENAGEIGDLIKRINFLEKDGKIHIQKVGLLRFNPFRELGGDHSFCLAILNGEDSGVVITSLHTRDRTRVYMKDIKKGKSSTELSIEEKKVLASAQKS
jgi:hypothetical protein